MSYFPEPHAHTQKSWLCSKIWLKNATVHYNLVCLKSDDDKLDIDKLKNVSSGLSNLKSILDKWYADKLLPFRIDLSKLSDV